MVDHLGRAEELRQRATKCIVAAKDTTSPVFKTCYDLLAANYLIQARLEEDYAAGTDRIALVARQAGEQSRRFSH
jgi:hypothetical protein